MFKSLVVLFVAIVLANGDIVALTQRSGEFNRYFLYNSAVTGVELDTTTESTDFIDDATTVVVVHGHGESYLTSLNPDLRRELLASGDINVIAVDWSIFAAMSYSNADAAVPSVGVHIYDLLVFQGIEPEDIHLVGFNLGAHIIGFTGRSFGDVARITALDPSKSSNRVGPSDALYVEVIHTDGSGLFNNGLGVQLGDADFFVNGGSSQPGCWGSHDCCHNRAWRYFVASINDNTFNANCCNTILLKNLNRCGSGSILPMGGNELTKTPCASGIYRVNTRSSYPF